MKKVTLTTAALTAMIALSTTSTTFAETVNTANSTGIAELTAGKNTDPVDPIDPGDDPGTGNVGDLTLDVVPWMDFGQMEIGAKDTLFTAPKVGSAASNMADGKDGHVQVTDVRGTGAGWTVQMNYVAADGTTAAKADEAWATEDGSLKLKGPVLSLPAATWSMDKEGTKTEGKPSISSAITSVSDAPATVATAGTDEGMGSWLGKMANADIKLDVPQGNKVGKYTAHLLWTLSDAPIA